MFSDSMMLGGGRKAAFSIANSVCLDGVADYFTRTPTVAGNRKTWTFSCWVKPSASSAWVNYLTSCYTNDSNRSLISFDGDRIFIFSQEGGDSNVQLRQTAFCRDCSAWMHVLISVDTTQTVSTDRVKLFINGDIVTLTGMFPGQDLEFYYNITRPTTLGVTYWNSALTGQYRNYLTQLIFVDGTALPPSAFGETDPVTGSWRPKRISGLDFGANGFYLDFSNPNYLGLDVSGNATVAIQNSAAPHWSGASGFVFNGTDITETSGVEKAIHTTSISGDFDYQWTYAGSASQFVLFGAYLASQDGGFNMNAPGAGFASMPINTGWYVDMQPSSGQIRGSGGQTFGTTPSRSTGDVFMIRRRNGTFTMWKNDALQYTWTASSTEAVRLFVAHHNREQTHLLQAVSWSSFSQPSNSWLPVSLGAADVVTDTPTNNFVTLNPLDNNAVTLSNGNRYGAGNSSAWRAVRGTFQIPATGKWGFKVEKVANPAGSGSGQSNCWFGLVKTTPLVTALSAPSTGDTNWLALGDHGWSSNFAVQADQSAPLNSADTAELLVDRDAGTFIFKKNGTQIQAGSLGFNGPLVPGYVVFSSAITMVFDFGQAGYTPSDPAYKALCTANLPKPAIQAPAKHMDVVTYTGTGAPQTITGLDFAPDLVWIKARSNPTASWLHRLTSRGLTQPNYLSPNATDAETSIIGNITSLDANGFTTNGNGGVGESGVSHVAWCWKAGGELVANSAGTVASTVSANPAAGFSIVTWDGIAANATLGHGLGAAPKFIIAKCRSAGSTDWPVYISTLGANNRLSLSGTNASSAGGDWNATAPTATVFSVGATPNTNADGQSYVAYCWAEIPGFSKFASYGGNGSSDGPFVHCGFRPRFVLIKRTDAAGNWSIVDTERSPANDGTWESLQANSALPESNIAVDGLSTGFKIRDTGGDINASGGTYIFAAFAEAPLGGAKTVPAKAR